MKEIILQKRTCEECEECCTKLINYETKGVLLEGDYYHDKIDHQIEGFIKGLEYAGVNVVIEQEATLDNDSCELI